MSTVHFVYFYLVVRCLSYSAWAAANLAELACLVGNMVELFNQSQQTVVADLMGNPVYSFVFGVCQSSKKFFEGLTEEAGKGGNVFLSTLATSCHHQRHLARP